MPDVIIRVKMDPASMVDMQGMTRVAIARAMMRARENIKAYAKEITPRRSGTLAESFDVATTPMSIFMKWDAMDPRSGYHYAKVVDEGRPGGVLIQAKRGGWLKFYWEKMGKWMRRKWVIQGAMTGARFSDHMRMVAPQFVREAIIEELQGMNLP